MIGYTRKVGLRKSRLHFGMLRARRIVRQAAGGAKGDDWQWLTDALEQIKRESGDPGVTVAIERAACPHCPCTYSTECCYCDCDGSDHPNGKA